jgi:hypothetical protein
MSISSLRASWTLKKSSFEEERDPDDPCEDDEAALADEVPVWRCGLEALVFRSAITGCEFVVGSLQ